MTRALVLAFSLLLAGCLSLDKVPPRDFYVLEDLRDGGAAVRGNPSDRVLLVAPTSVSQFYDTLSLVYSRAPGQRAYYQFAAWTERPGARLTTLLIRRLSAGGAFRAVASTTAGAAGDFILNTRLEELYYDARANPGSVRIELSAEMVDPERRTIVARCRFAQSARTDRRHRGQRGCRVRRSRHRAPRRGGVVGGRRHCRLRRPGDLPGLREFADQGAVETVALGKTGATQAGAPLRRRPPTPAPPTPVARATSPRPPPAR